MKLIGHILLTDSDFENILLWYHRAFERKDDCSTSDKNTLTKLEALLIVEKESEDRFSPPIGRFGRFE